MSQTPEAPARDVIAKITVDDRLTYSEFGGPALEAMDVPQLRQVQRTLLGWVRLIEERAIAKKRPMSDTVLVSVQPSFDLKVSITEAESEDGQDFETAVIASLLNAIEDDPARLEQHGDASLDEFEQPWPYRVEHDDDGRPLPDESARSPGEDGDQREATP